MPCNSICSNISSINFPSFFPIFYWGIFRLRLLCHYKSSYPPTHVVIKPLHLALSFALDFGRLSLGLTRNLIRLSLGLACHLVRLSFCFAGALGYGFLDCAGNLLYSDTC